MKRYIAIFLALSVILGLCACATAPAQPMETAAAIETAEPTPEPTPEATPEPTPEPKPGEIFLSVSSIIFSIVGESENIYVGTVPVEEVTWEIADESIVTIENGVLTAVGTGETTVTAKYEDQTMSCTAGCLAATEADFYMLYDGQRRQPKRIPVHLENPPYDYFDDVVFIGDSITYFFYYHDSFDDMIGDAAFLTRGGTGIIGLERRSYNIQYQGEDTNIEDCVAKVGRNKVYLMLGQNDLPQLSVEAVLELYDTIITRIVEKNPGVEIYIQSVLNEWWTFNTDKTRNDKIDAFNIVLEEYAEEKGYHYVDIGMYIEDHYGSLALPYDVDHLIHVNKTGCIEWANALLSYAYVERLWEK